MFKSYTSMSLQLYVITMFYNYFLKDFTISTHPSNSDGWFLVAFFLLPLHMNDKCFLQIL